MAKAKTAADDAIAACGCWKDDALSVLTIITGVGRATVEGVPDLSQIPTKHEIYVSPKNNILEKFLVYPTMKQSTGLRGNFFARVYPCIFRRQYR